MSGGYFATGVQLLTIPSHLGIPSNSYGYELLDIGSTILCFVILPFFYSLLL